MNYRVNYRVHTRARVSALVALLVVCALSLASCAYSAKTPLAEPSTAIDQTLLGDWTSHNAEDKTEGDAVTITRHSDAEYIVQTQTKEVNTKKKSQSNANKAASAKAGATKTESARGKKSLDKRDMANLISTMFIVHATNLGGATFLNLRDAKKDKDSAPEYMFFKLERPAPDELVVTPVSRRIKEKFGNVEDLRAFFLKNKDLSVFYDHEEAITLRRRPAK